MELSGENLLLFSTALKLELSKELPGICAQLSMSPSIRQDLLGNTQPNNLTRQSAVLALFFEQCNNIELILIKRQVYDGPHSGQISFPGGKYEDMDGSIQKTALRETKEEVGIDPSSIELIGNLTPLYIPISNIMVHPFVGFIHNNPVFHPNLQEVDYIITVSLKDLIDPQNKSVKVISPHGKPITAPYYNVKNEMIWGATAMIIAELLEVINRLMKK